MVTKRISRALEGGILLGVNILGNLTKLTNFPVSLVKEAKSFMERNSLAVVACNIEDKELIHECCPNCLQAHLLKRAKEKGYIEESAIIQDIFEFDIGHDGYYIDKGKLLRV